jgi:hypothetical protein
MLFRELGKVVEGARDIVGAVTFDGPEVAVQGIDDEQAGLGSLEGVLEHGEVAEAERRRLGGGGVEDSAE